LSAADKNFSGRAAIVTGATRGIGRAIALELARQGADVAFNYAKSAEAAESLKAEIEALGVRALAAQGDVANTAAAAEMVKQTKDAFGRIDFLVNNAGIVRDTLILRMKEDDWDAVIDTNLKGAWNFAKYGRTVQLLGIKGRHDWIDEGAGARSGEPEGYCECPGARDGSD
jgi:3-oxoacyl-[acyl-carrier protein] reductase